MKINIVISCYNEQEVLPKTIDVLGKLAVRIKHETDVDTQLLLVDDFDANGKAIPEKMTTLKNEIDLGIWDTYLFWDWESYQNLQNQNNIAVVFANVMKNNTVQQPTINIKGDVSNELPAKK